MSDLERVTKLAKECGFSTWNFVSGVAHNATAKELLAFEQAVLEKQSAEIELLKGQVKWEREEADRVTDIASRRAEEIESLQAKLAMQAEALQLAYQKKYHAIRYEQIETALNATRADVDNWMQGKKAEWERAVLEKHHKESAEKGTIVEASLEQEIDALRAERSKMRAEIEELKQSWRGIRNVLESEWHEMWNKEQPHVSAFGKD